MPQETHQVPPGAWQRVATLHAPRYNLGATAHDGPIYAIGDTVGAGSGAMGPWPSRPVETIEVLAPFAGKEAR